MTSPLPVHDELGVHWGLEDGSERVPRHYGDPAHEYHAARTAAAVVDRCDRRIVRLYGRDPARILQGIITNDIAAAPGDRAVYAALLTPKGRMIADTRIVRANGEFLLELSAAALPALFDTFKRTVPPLFARYEDVSDAWHVLGVHGPHAAELLRRTLGVEQLPESEDALVEARYRDERCFIVGTRYAGDDGFDVVASTPAATALWHEQRAGGAVPLGHAALEVLRIEAGVPRWGTELTSETIPLEAGLKDRAISTSKGCYTGQEVIIRILHRGHVNWQLRGVLFGQGAVSACELVQPETGKVAGRVTSTAWSPRLDQEIGLAYIRREVEPGSSLHAGDVAGPGVTIVTLPFTA